MNITFKLQYNSAWGEVLHVVGSDEVLGSWDASKALKLSYESGSWVGTAQFAKISISIQYKYVITNTNNPSSVRWEDRENRILSLRGRFKGHPLVIHETWNGNDRRVDPIESPNQEKKLAQASRSKAEKKARKSKRRAEKKERASNCTPSQETAKITGDISTPTSSTTTTTTTTSAVQPTTKVEPVEIPHWMQRTRILLGPEKVTNLMNSNVILVGLGGVGAFAAEMIARAGVGKMTIIDNDTVDITNCNRQLGALHGTVGQVKAQVLGARLRDINPKLELTELAIYINDGKAQKILDEQKYDYAMDCIDTLSSKCWFIRSCKERRIPIASSMGAGGKVDPSKIHSGDISEVSVCKFGQVVRKRLHKWGIRDGIPVVWSEEPVDPEKLIKTPNNLKKTTIGTISYMPAIFGCTLASLVLRDLYNRNQ